MGCPWRALPSIRIVGAVLLALGRTQASALRLQPAFNPPRGFVTLDPASDASAARFRMVARPDGRILAVGYETLGQHSDLVLVQWLANASLATAIAVQRNGRVVLSGWSGNGKGTACFLLRLAV